MENYFYRIWSTQPIFFRNCRISMFLWNRLWAASGSYSTLITIGALKLSSHLMPKPCSRCIDKCVNGIRLPQRFARTPLTIHHKYFFGWKNRNLLYDMPYTIYRIYALIGQSWSIISIAIL